MIIKGSKTHVYQIRKVVVFFLSVEVGWLKKISNLICHIRKL